MAAPLLQFKRGNAGIGGTVPALRPGEPAISLNNFDFFIGIDTSVANNKFFGSHRYWGRENGTNSLNLKLVDKDGVNSINLKSPDTLSGTGTYTLPDTNTIVDGYYLKVSTGGVLSWTAVGSNSTLSNSTLTGITTISDVLNVLANTNFTGIVTVTDLYVDSTRVLYDDGSGITLAGIQTIDATTKQTLESVLALEPNDFQTLNVAGIATVGGLIDGNGGADISGQTELDNLNVSVAATFASATVSNLTSGRVVLSGVGGVLQDSGNLTFDNTSLTIGTGVGVTQFSASVSTGTSTSSVPTSSAVIDYVTSQITNVDQDDDLSIAGDTGTGVVDLDTQTLTIAGTLNEIVTSVSGQTVTVGLPDNIVVGIVSATTEVRTPAVKAADGTSAISITNSTGAVQTNSDLTVSGNLYVNGSTTQVNTASLTVEDRTIELGIVDGAAPSSATTWDLGVLFNYNDGTAKKSALVWEQGDARFKLGSVVTDGGGTGSSNPQLTLTTYAALEIADLWINNACTGGSAQVIGCVGSELHLQNIVIDAGQF